MERQPRLFHATAAIGYGVILSVLVFSEEFAALVALPLIFVGAEGHPEIFVAARVVCGLAAVASIFTHRRLFSQGFKWSPWFQGISLAPIVLWGAGAAYLSSTVFASFIDRIFGGIVNPLVLAFIVSILAALLWLATFPVALRSTFKKRI